MFRRNYLALSAVLLLLSSSNWAPSSPEKPHSIGVLSFNSLFLNFDIHATLEVIQNSGADIIGLQETSAQKLEWLADQLGYFYHSFNQASGNIGPDDTGILTRFPILRKSPNGVALSLGKGEELAVLVAHLTPFPYQPHQVRDGRLTSARDLQVEAARLRLPAVQKMLEEADQLAGPHCPLIFLGDFNEPSHLDWTSRAAALGRHFGLAVEFPCSSFLQDKGFVDLFREVFPDEDLVPGHTWPATPSAGEVSDRIDFIYFRGRQWQVCRAGNLGKGEMGEKFPSDHQAVYAWLERDPI